MKIIGVHDGHNAAATLLEDGKIVFAIEEERLTGIKNHSTFPKHAIQYLLDYTNQRPQDIDTFVFSSNHIPEYKTRESLMQQFKESNSLSTKLKRLAKKTPLWDYKVKKRTKERFSFAVDAGFKAETIHFMDHHQSHAAAAYFGSPWWRDEKILVLTNDGGGDGLCATVSIGRGGRLRRLAEVPVSESIGYLYSMITFILGMVPEEHEYKIMGMSPYGSASRSEALSKMFASLVRFDQKSKGITWKRTKGCPHFQYSYRYLKKLLDLQRFDIICRAIQDFTEDFMVTWVSNCIQATGIRKVVMAGGVLMNVKANKRIMEIPALESLFIYPTCGDPTNSMGAAYYMFAKHCQDQNIPISLSPLEDLYFGPEFPNEVIKQELDTARVHYTFFEDIEKKVATLLFKGEVVARFKGRMEFGARAMGNRSILANPENRDTIKVINEMIKNRDFWMPFAPSLIEEEAENILVNPKKIPAPYMIMSFDCGIPHEKIYTASHPYDHTLRPQVVFEKWNPDYYRLIRNVKELSGIGVILNTSFNLHGFPIVCKPSEAINVFNNSGLKHMAIGDYLVSKES
jgi:carbamoyltransferase